MLEGINFLSMVSEMNVLNGIFYKREMFQPKYYWIEIKFLGSIQNPRRHLFVDVIMLFLKIHRHLHRLIAAYRRELEKLVLAKSKVKYDWVNEVFRLIIFMFFSFTWRVSEVSVKKLNISWGISYLVVRNHCVSSILKSSVFIPVRGKQNIFFEILNFHLDL